MITSVITTVITKSQMKPNSTWYANSQRIRILMMSVISGHDLRKIYNRNEITKDQYDNIRPVSTKPARALGLPKIHKTFDSLPSFRPIIDTTGTAYQPVAKYLAKLLNPIVTNEFTVKGSFDAVTHINNILRNLFNDGYRFVSFDVTSLFTNIPLKKTVNIILKRIY